MAKTKRGNIWQDHEKDTRTQKGYRKLLADRNARTEETTNITTAEYDEKTKLIRQLAVKGSLDSLAKKYFGSNFATATKHHPDDPSYTKTVIVLSDRGKRNLMKKKEKRTCT